MPPTQQRTTTLMCGQQSEAKMTQWILQSRVPSITPATRNRTAYLAPLLNDVIAAIKAYFETKPDGEDVTLAVLQALGYERLQLTRGTRTFGRVKQDVGLLVAQTLADLYGANYVETLRRGDGKSVSARRNTWPTLDWVNSFAPHRRLHRGQRIARILLDTGVVRKVIHGDVDSLSPTVLIGLKGEHPVSIADGAFAELSAALLRGSIAPSTWAERIGLFDELLDPDFPVAPGGKELAAFWGGHSPVGLNVDEARAYYRAAWGYLRNARSAEDLTREEIFYAPSGRAYAIQFDAEHVEAVLSEEGRKWSGWVANIAALIGDLHDVGDRVTEADLRRLMTSHLMLDMAVTNAMKLDLVVHVLAKWAMQAVTKREPYNPNGRPNDLLDLDLLFGIPLPAWVCTSDERLHRLVHLTESADRHAVMTAEELLDRLRAEARGTAA